MGIIPRCLGEGPICPGQIHLYHASHWLSIRLPINSLRKIFNVWKGFWRYDEPRCHNLDDDATPGAQRKSLRCKDGKSQPAKMCPAPSHCVAVSGSERMKVTKTGWWCLELLHVGNIKLTFMGWSCIRLVSGDLQFLRCGDPQTSEKHQHLIRFGGNGCIFMLSIYLYTYIYIHTYCVYIYTIYIYINISWAFGIGDRCTRLRPPFVLEFAKKRVMLSTAK